MRNKEIAEIFRKIAQILEIKGDNPFRIRAYERAGKNIESLPEDISGYLTQGRLEEIPGIGKDLADKIKEYIEKGKISAYEELKKAIPEGCLALLEIPGVGPKTAKLLYDKFGIAGIQDLEKAIRSKKLAGAPGIKEKTIENILKGIAILKKGRERMSLFEAIQLASGFVKPLEKLPQIKRIVPAGSLRRRKETVRDIDILVSSDSTKAVMDAFIKLPLVSEILAKGQTKISARTKEGAQVDCRVVKENSFGAALLYFTGAKNFNIKIRKRAIKKGLKVNEYGVFRRNKYIAGKSEEEIFKKLGLSFIEPELREDTGEIELAEKFKLPDLIRLNDIKGDLHAHSDWSDGGNSIEEMARAARLKGYSYIVITDHSQSLKVAGGLTERELIEKKKQIDKLNRQMKDFRVLYGTEVDIASNGSLDYPDSVLKEFDVVVAAIHTGFKQSKQQLTKRLVRACWNKYSHIIAHPTGRLRGVRDEYEVDFNEVFKAAKDTNTRMEINSFPDRLDLDSVNSRHAKEAGVKFAIDTDAHAIGQLGLMELGVSVARRAWLSCDDVINTLDTESLLKAIKKYV